MQPLKIYAEWNNESTVWVATSDDLKGLSIEASTIDEMIENLKILIPELMGLNQKELSGNNLPFDLIKTWPVISNLSCF
jgi:predicted RNase H-like HicB family nuclease